MSARRAAFFHGFKAELPILAGAIPFGLIYGILARDAGLSAPQAQSMSTIVFAGSAQFVMAQLFGTGTPPLVIFLTGSLVNLRHILYSASMAPYLSSLKPYERWGLAYLLTDEAYAVTITHFQQVKEYAHRHWFYAGAGLTLWATWQSSTAAGVFLGSQIPASWSLDFVVPLSFIALVMPVLIDQGSAAAAITAGVVSLLTLNFPFRLGLVVSAIIGIVAGFLVEELFKDNPARPPAARSGGS